MTPHPIIYDPDCGFCRVCVALVLRWDREGKLTPVALKSPEANELLAGMPEDQQMASWHLVEPAETGPVWSGGAAFSPLFRLLPHAAPLARLTDRFPGGSRRAYRWVADRRSAFGTPLPAAAKRWADRVISESERNSR
jgi:predicted DCC family thiol-disulfide oxidoreductase YuxK